MGMKMPPFYARQNPCEFTSRLKVEIFDTKISIKPSIELVNPQSWGD